MFIKHFSDNDFILTSLCLRPRCTGLDDRISGERPILSDCMTTHRFDTPKSSAHFFDNTTLFAWLVISHRAEVGSHLKNPSLRKNLKREEGRKMQLEMVKPLFELKISKSPPYFPSLGCCTPIL